MINYSVDSSIRKKVIVIIFVVSLLLLNPINFVLLFIYDLIIRVLPFTVEWFGLLSKVGIPVSEVTLLGVFAILYFLFCRIGWKLKFITKITGIPNLNGLWKGKLISSHTNKETSKNTVLEMSVEIIQDWNSISIRAEFPTSSSYSKTASLHTNEQKGIVLGFSFRNDSMNVGINSREFSGYNELVYKSNALVGVYYTNRDGGTHGTIELEKMQEKME